MGIREDLYEQPTLYRFLPFFFNFQLFIMTRSRLKNLRVIFLFALFLSVFVYSCREEEHPGITFLPSAQITFVDSIIEIDLTKVDLSIEALLKASVSSPVGLAKIQIAQVNTITTNTIDTVVVNEFTSFADPNHWEINGDVLLAGYTKGINVRVFDTQGQMSQRMLPVKLYNTKLAPSIKWLNSNGSVNTTYVTDGITVKMYGSTPSVPTLRATLESRNGNEWSWGLDRISTYLIFRDGRKELIEEASRNFSTNPCSGCRNAYDIASYTPAYTEDVVQIKMEVVDLKMQKTESYINVKVYETYPAPNIMYTKSVLKVDDNDLNQAKVEFTVTSEDSRFAQFTYSLIHTDGSVEQVATKTTGFSHPRADPTASDHVVYQLSTVNDIVAFRLEASNEAGKSSIKELPIQVMPGADGVRHLRDIVVYTEDNDARPYVYSVAANAVYSNLDLGITNPDFYFRCTNDSYIYADSPVNLGSKWQGNKTRRTYYLKITPKFDINFETATKSQILQLDSLVKRDGELSISAGNRTKKSLTTIVISAVVDDQGRLVNVVESNTGNIVAQDPSTWVYTHIGDLGHAAVVTRDDAALNTTYAFVTQDGIVGLLNISEGLAYQPDFNVAAIKMQRKRVSFSIKTVIQ